MVLSEIFFERTPIEVAISLLGKVIRVAHDDTYLSAQIVETEAYYLDDKGSHASLGYTHKRRALFMEPGTIYMYYARGGDSLNMSCAGEGNAVLIKACKPYLDEKSHPNMIAIMQDKNPIKGSGRIRQADRLLSGQTLLCRALGLKVPDWDARSFIPNKFFIEDCGVVVERYVQTTRLGIPAGRDEHLLYRFIDYNEVRHATSKWRMPYQIGTVQK